MLPGSCHKYNYESTVIILHDKVNTLVFQIKGKSVHSIDGHSRLVLIIAFVCTDQINNFYIDVTNIASENGKKTDNVDGAVTISR